MTNIPTDAMEVANGLETQNFVRFVTTDVLEWYTVSLDGTVSCEKFVSNTPVCPEDIPIGLGEGQ